MTIGSRLHDLAAHWRHQARGFSSDLRTEAHVAAKLLEIAADKRTAEDLADEWGNSPDRLVRRRANEIRDVLEPTRSPS